MKNDGFYLKAGDDFSKMAFELGHRTWGSSRYVKVHDFAVDNFRGPRGFRFENLPEGYFFDLAPDGIGTKVVLITEAFTHAQASKDLLAMTCGDLTRWGGLPLVFSNVLDVSTLGEPREHDAPTLR